MKDRVLTVLRSVPFLAEAGEQTVKAILSEKVLSYGKGKVIDCPESYYRGIGIVISGAVSVFTKSRETPAFLNTLKPGGVFGVASLFKENEEYVSTVRAGTKCEVLLIPEVKMKEILRGDPEVSMAYIRFLTERICFLNKKIAGFSASSAEEAVSLFLLDQREKDRADSFPVNVSRLSKMLGFGRMSVYRVFHTLSEEGILSFAEGAVTVLSEDGLRQKAGKM